MRDPRDLRAIGWNCHGVALRKRGKVLDTLHAQFDFDFAFFQEWSRAGAEKELFDRCIVYSAPPMGAWLRSAIAVHVGHAHAIEGEPLCSGRCIALNINLDGWPPLRLISAHLHAHTTRRDFEATIQQVRDCLNYGADDRQVILSIDAQDGLGQDHTRCGSSVGQWSVDEAGWRGDLVLELLREFDLVAVNTLRKGIHGQHTCYYDNKQQPKQIDYICCSRSLVPRLTCEVRITDAKKSDHRPLFLKA